MNRLMGRIGQTVHSSLFKNMGIYRPSLRRELKFHMSTTRKESNSMNQSEKQISSKISINEKQQNNPYNISEVRQYIHNYPFIKPITTSVKQLNKSNVSQQIKQNLIAWRCLATRDKIQLKQASRILIPQKYHLQHTESKINYNGYIIFTAYFQKHLRAMIDNVNSKAAGTYELIGIFNILIHMKTSQLVREHVKRLDFSKIAAVQGQERFFIQACLIAISALNSLPYVDYLNPLDLYLRQKEFSFLKLRTAYVLTQIPYFYKYYQKGTIKAIFFTFRQSLQKIDSKTVLIILKKAYQHHSKYACMFAQDLLRFIMEVDQQRSQNLFPLILKIINYCNMLEVNNQPMILHIIKNPQHFDFLIKKEELTRQIFVNTLFSKCKSKFSSEGLDALSKHIEQHLQKYIAGEGTQREIVSLLELVDIYSKELSAQVVNKFAIIVLKYLKKYTETDSKFVYKGLSFILSTIEPFSEEQKKLIGSILKEFFIKSCKLWTDYLYITSNINECINLISKLYFSRLQMNPKDIPNLCRIRFREFQKYSMDQQTLQNLLRYLVAKGNSQEQLKQFMYQSENIIFSSFNNKKMKFRMTMNILEIAIFCNHKNTNFYAKIIRCLVQIMNKYPHFVLTPNDLEVLNKGMVKREEMANPSFIKFIKSCLEEPESWERNREDFLKRQKQYTQIQREKKLRIQRVYEVL